LKHLEKAYAEGFLAASGLGSGCELVGMKRPDYRLLTSEGEIGLEVTRLYRDMGPDGSPEAEQYGLLECVCDEAKRLHLNRNGENLHISVMPSPHV
jgi:hypothetical protein